MSLLKLLLYFGMAFCLAVSDRHEVEGSENSSWPLPKTSRPLEGTRVSDDYSTSSSSRPGPSTRPSCTCLFLLGDQRGAGFSKGSRRPSALTPLTLALTLAASSPAWLSHSSCSAWP
jgi:hypothetical protein